MFVHPKHIHVSRKTNANCKLQGDELSTWVSGHSQPQCKSYCWGYCGSSRLNGIMQCKQVFPTRLWDRGNGQVPMCKSHTDKRAWCMVKCILDAIQSIKRKVWFDLDFDLQFNFQKFLSQRTMKLNFKSIFIKYVISKQGIRIL